MSHEILHCLTLEPCFRPSELKSQPIGPLCIVLLLYPLASQVEHLLLPVDTLDEAEFGCLLPPVLEVAFELCQGVHSLPYLMGLECPAKSQPDLCHMDIVLKHLVLIGDLLGTLSSLLQMQLQDLVLLLHPLILADLITHQLSSLFQDQLRLLFHFLVFFEINTVFTAILLVHRRFLLLMLGGF